MTHREREDEEPEPPGPWTDEAREEAEARVRAALDARAAQAYPGADAVSDRAVAGLVERIIQDLGHRRARMLAPGKELEDELEAVLGVNRAWGRDLVHNAWALMLASQAKARLDGESLEWTDYYADSDDAAGLGTAPGLARLAAPLLAQLRAGEAGRGPAARQLARASRHARRALRAALRVELYTRGALSLNARTFARTFVRLLLARSNTVGEMKRFWHALLEPAVEQEAAPLLDALADQLPRRGKRRERDEGEGEGEDADAGIETHPAKVRRMEERLRALAQAMARMRVE
jgi:hypothetical protein